MNHFKVKTWGGFDLAILNIKQIHYKRIEVFTIKFNPKSIATSSSNLLTRPFASSKSMDSFSFWIYSNTNLLACDFEIPLKGFRSRSVMILMQQLCSTKTLDYRFCSSRFSYSQKVQNFLDLIKNNAQVFSALQNMARVSLLYVVKFR